MAKRLTQKEAEKLGYNRKEADKSFKKTVKKYKETGQTDFNTKQETKTKTTQPETIDLRTEEKKTDSSIKTQLEKVQKFGENLVSGKYTDLGKKYEEETGGKKILQLVYTGPSFGGTSLINNRIPDKSVEAAGRAAGLTKKGIGQLKFKLGEARINQVLNTLTNTKSQSLIAKTMAKLFSGKALAFYGAAVSSLVIGKWGQKETPEPLLFPMRDAYKQAQTSGDWTLYEEAKANRLELTDMNKWEKFLSWTPFISPFITIPKAIIGGIQGGKLIDEVAKQEQTAQENGETADDKWERIEEERQATREAERIEDEAYYKQVQDDIESAKADARVEDEKYWNKVLREREEYETAKREAEEKYWEDVRKLNEELRKIEQKSYEDYGKSNLDFGLL